MPNPYRFTSAVPPRQATGLVAEVYGQMKRDFLLADGPLMCLSPVPDLLAATWSLVREAEIAGPAPRMHTEALAAAISRHNRCTFCTDAHTALVHATGAHDLAEAVWHGLEPADSDVAMVIRWGLDLSMDGPVTLQAPGGQPEWTPAYAGTLLVTHVLNRIVSVLLNESMLPGRMQGSHIVRRAAGRVMSRFVRRQVTPGDSLTLLPPDERPIPAWAGTSAAGPAWHAVQRAGTMDWPGLDTSSLAVLACALDQWDGTLLTRDSARYQPLIEEVPGRDRLALRVALLAAIGPHVLEERELVAIRQIHGEAGLIRLVAGGAILATNRIERRLLRNSPVTRCLR
jgi:AhpD family alkylhydroperoxidase